MMIRCAPGASVGRSWDGRALAGVDADVAHAVQHRCTLPLFLDWYGEANVTVTLLRTEAGRDPHNKELRDLIGELSTLSTASATPGPVEAKARSGSTTGSSR